MPRTARNIVENIAIRWASPEWTRACPSGTLSGMDTGGAYPADRAAALSGVPKSTIHYWARNRILVPSASPSRVKLWSFADLLCLRTIYWLRQPKKARDGFDIPRTTMRTVGRAMAALHELDLSVLEERRPTVAVDRSGHVYLTPPRAHPRTPYGQTASADLLDLIAPFSVLEGLRGPDLREPSRFVRIIPRKLSGATHVVDTRLESLALHALELRGFSLARIAALYPSIEHAALEDALALERQLAQNLQNLAA